MKSINHKGHKGKTQKDTKGRTHKGITKEEEEELTQRATEKHGGPQREKE